MKKTILAWLLMAGMLLGPTGCGESVMQNAADKVLRMEPDASFMLGETYSDQQVSITPELVILSETGVMAPMTEEEDGSVSAYTAEDKQDHLYLDYVATVENTGTDSMNLQEDLLVYALEGENTYNECIILAENGDGTDMEDAGTLESGASVRVHYGLILPADLSEEEIELRFMMPESAEIYSAPLEELQPKAADLTKDKAVKRADGVSLTLKSAKIADTVESVSPAGGGYALRPQTEGNQMMDVVLEVTNGSGQDISLGTVYSGLMLQKHVAKPAMIVMEANQDMLYSGTIKAGSRVITHLVFELQEQPDDNSRVYVYFGGTYHTVIWEK